MELLKFNVVIPTRERSDTLYHSLRTVVAQDYDNLNIIVSDNFSGDETREVVASFRDPRVKYINTGSRISMSHNWEFALGHVAEGWVTFIGDDDGLLPGAIPMLNGLVQEHGVEAVSCQNHVHYVWPDHYTDNPDGFFLLKLDNSVRQVDSLEQVRRIFSGELDSYHKLPGCYHGAASVDLINRLRDGSGRFFCSQIPDVYAAIALSFGTTRFLSLNRPFSVAGISKHSNGRAALSSTSVAAISAIEQFKSENNIQFDKSLIMGVSTHIMVYESYLQSFHVHNNMLSLDLVGQLEVAIKNAPSAFEADIRRECEQIAERNGLGNVCDRVRVPRAGITGYLRKTGQFLSQISFFAKRMKLDNVYEAAMFASHLHRLASASLVNRWLLGLMNVFEYPRRKLRSRPTTVA